MRGASDGGGTSRGGISSTGVGTGAAACGAGADADADGSAGCVGGSSSVFLKSAASGPSLMLARLPDAMSENLLREIAIGLGGRAVRVVLQDGHPLDVCLRKPHRLLDPRREQPIAEVLLE